MDRIVEFLFEVGMLKRTPRSGWQFLGTGSESVAEHVFRTAMIGFVLARLDGKVDADKMLRMALAHDLPETRTGDLNYVNQKYVAADETRAADDMTRGLPFGDELRELMAEYRRRGFAQRLCSLTTPINLKCSWSSRKSWTLAVRPPRIGPSSCSGDCGPRMFGQRSGRKNPRWRFRIVVVRPRLGMVGARGQGLSSIWA